MWNSWQCILRVIAVIGKLFIRLIFIERQCFFCSANIVRLSFCKHFAAREGEK